MLIVSGLKWQVFQRMVGNAKDVEDARIVTAKLLGLVRAVGGITTIQFVTHVINKGTRFVFYRSQVNIKSRIYIEEQNFVYLLLST